MKEAKVYKLCIVSPSLTMGGVERSSTNLANTLASIGNQIIYISVFKKAHFFKLLPGIKFIEPPDFNNRKLSFIKTFSYIRNAVSEEKPDAILVYTKFAAALVTIALIGTTTRIFISERSSPLYKWPVKIRIFNYIAFKLKKPKGIISQTEYAINFQMEYYGNTIPITAIPNPLGKCIPGSSADRENFILAVGRLNDHSKGFDRLLKAFSMIPDKQWKLVFAGGDTSGYHLQVMADQLNVKDRVSFLGSVENLDELYARAGIFVIPSRTEGFPNALCEAMAHGLPCVSFDFKTGPREIIANGIDGIIVEDGNLSEMAKAIQFLIENKTERERLGANAMRISEKLDPVKISYEYLTFIVSN